MKKYFLGLSLIIFLLLGIFLSKSGAVPSTGTQGLIGSSSLVVTPDIRIYSTTAVAIIVGEVADFTNNYTDVNVKEVIKGDKSMTKVSILIQRPMREELISDDSAILNPGEDVLLFLCKNSAGDYVVCGESAGKGLIDEDNNVFGEPAFSLPLTDLRAKIQAVLNS